MSKGLIGFSAGAAALLFWAACSTSDSKFNNGSDDGGLDESSGDEINFNPSGDAAVGIIVTPPTANLTASGSPVTQQFQAVMGDTKAPVMPQWSLDNVALGS